MRHSGSQHQNQQYIKAIRWLDYARIHSSMLIFIFLLEQPWLKHEIDDVKVFLSVSNTD